MKKIILAVCVICFAGDAAAQKPKLNTRAGSVVKFKPPKLIAAIGTFNDTASITVKEAGAVIGMPLKITDTKGAPYTISSYQFLYRKIVTSEDEATGKAYNTTAVKSSLFKTSPLPDLWIKVLSEELRPGEEFIFFDIIVRDGQGRVMYAPDILLKLK